MITPGHSWKGGVDYFLSEIFFKVLEKDPDHGTERVQEWRIKMLNPMCRYPGLRTAHADKRAFGNVVVDAVDICVCVMNDVVLLFPDETISTQGIQREPKDFVDPFAGGIAAVVGIVHDIESDGGKYQT